MLLTIFAKKTLKATGCLTLCLCLALSAFSIQSKAYFDDSHAVKVATVQNVFPNIFRPIGNIFTRLFGKQRHETYCPVPSVTNLTLSRDEVIAGCEVNQNYCTGSKGIGVYSQASNPVNDVITYVYNVSGGKIIGQGDKVIWDLSGVKPGTYTITAGVDNSCGVCGRTQTKTVKVIECPDCK